MQLVPMDMQNMGQMPKGPESHPKKRRDALIAAIISAGANCNPKEADILSVKQQFLTEDDGGFVMLCLRCGARGGPGRYAYSYQHNHKGDCVPIPTSLDNHMKYKKWQHALSVLFIELVRDWSRKRKDHNDIEEERQRAAEVSLDNDEPPQPRFEFNVQEIASGIQVGDFTLDRNCVDMIVEPAHHKVFVNELRNAPETFFRLVTGILISRRLFVDGRIEPLGRRAPQLEDGTKIQRAFELLSDLQHTDMRLVEARMLLKEYLEENDNTIPSAKRIRSLRKASPAHTRIALE